MFSLGALLAFIIPTRPELEAALSCAAVAEREIDTLLEEKLAMRTQLTKALKRAQNAEAAVASAVLRNAALTAEVECLKRENFRLAGGSITAQEARHLLEDSQTFRAVKIPTDNELDAWMRGAG